LIDKPVRETILCPDELHLPFAIRLGVERGAKGEDAKEKKSPTEEHRFNVQLSGVHTRLNNE
jgi:hypothetical protein